MFNCFGGGSHSIARGSGDNETGVRRGWGCTLPDRDTPDGPVRILMENGKRLKRPKILPVLSIPDTRHKLQPRRAVLPQAPK
jgi:hypothetical protein